MSIPKLRKLLADGSQAWNDWRDQHPSVIPDLRKAMLPYDFNLSDYDLSFMNLSRMDFEGATLVRHKPATHFYGTNFQHANLSRANISKCVFHTADLSNANLCGAQLFSTHFFEDTSLIRTNLSESKLASAHFEGARLGWTVFGATDLSNVRGLEQASIEGPITIGMDTVFLSQGKIPATFLKKAQMPKQGISFVRSVTKRRVQYHSCFISYASRNEKFVNRLYTDLTNAGVVCWLAPEDLRGGEKFPEKIGEAIRSFDRFVVLVSKEALESKWVHREVKIATDQPGRDANFIVPIGLDDTVEISGRRWVRQLRGTTHIIAFKSRGQDQPYFDSLSRLLISLEKSPLDAS